MKHLIGDVKITFEGKKVENTTLNGISNYFSLYTVILGISFLLLSFEPFDFETNITAVVTCFNNVGPGFSMIGPSGNFSAYSMVSKYILSILMLLGRLEIYPILFALSPSTWAKKL